MIIFSTFIDYVIINNNEVSVRYNKVYITIISYIIKRK